MIIVARITLFAFQSVVAHALGKQQILNGIKPISNALEYNNNYSTLRDNGQKIFSHLIDFAESITMLNGQFNESDPIDQSIMSELEKIENSFGRIKNEYFNHEFSMTLENEIFVKKFESSVQDKVNQLQQVFIEFINEPNMNNKNVLTQTCNTTNGMKDVLTDLHIEIVNRDGNNGTFNQLLDGGVSLEDIHKIILMT